MKTFGMKTVIHFGDNALDRLREIPYKRVLIITDPFVVQSKMIDLITEPLAKGGIEYDIFSNVVPDAPVDKIADGVKKFLSYQPEAVIAVGGGSAIDSSKAIREFAKAQGLHWYFEQGKSGVEHAILPEAGVVAAGELIIGADSHTCTYGALGAFSTGVGTTDIATGMAMGELWFKVPAAIKFVLTGKPGKYVSGKDIIIHIIGKIGVDGALYKSMEFTGDGIRNLSMADRFTMANMAIEAGAKNGIFPVDEKTEEYLKEHTKKDYHVYEADEDAEYESIVEIDLSEVRPTVAFPHLPGNAKTIDEIEAMEPIKIDQVVIGSCTNGRMEDMRKAAAILQGHTVHPDVRVMVIPATQKIYKQCIREGLLEIFVDAGCAVNTPSCGPCMGGHMGVMAAGEKCVSTTNRNFVGRMGHVDSLIYLASPEVAAASAIAGYIANPEKVGDK